MSDSKNKITRIMQGLAIVSSSLLFTACAGAPPMDLGIQPNGRLLPCPKKPNCVSSFAATKDKTHYIAAYQIDGSTLLAWKALKNNIQNTKGAKIVISNQNYLYATYTSPFFHFVDDVEFLLNSSISKIDLRSASRIGYSDLGVNRKRINTLRNILKKEGVVK